MRRVKIITDSCADLTAEQLVRYDIDYVRMSTVENGVETPALLTWSDDEVHSLYDAMRDGRRITTAQVSIGEFNSVFMKYLDIDYDIVYIGCSSKQSGSVNTGSLVAKRLAEKYEGAKIACIDSLNASIGIGMLAIKAAELRDRGYNAEKIESEILSLRNRVNQYVTVHSLDALRRAGRVKGPAAFFGNLMGVKPIIISDACGEQTAYKKVKGRARSFEEIVNLLAESIEDSESQTIYVTHSDCDKEEIDMLVGMIKEKISCKGVEVGYIGPIIGASIGPDAVGIWGYGKEVTYKTGD